MNGFGRVTLRHRTEGDMLICIRAPMRALFTEACVSRHLPLVSGVSELQRHRFGLVIKVSIQKRVWM